MPDGELADGMIEAARSLFASGGSPSSDANLRRAISTAYYAVFHALAKVCADCLVGTDETIRPKKAWVEVYRGLDHGTSKNACEQARNIGFPDEVKEFAAAFRRLQEARHLCDYDPLVRPTEQETEFYVALAQRSVSALREAREKDRLAFATWTLITSKGAQQARVRARLVDPTRIEDAAPN